MTSTETVRIVAFLDANVILECRPLTDLPWSEINAEETILACVTRTAMREIDKRKRDGRLGKIARRFNQLVAPLALGEATIVIRESKPRVLLALSQAGPIDWEKHQDLDPDEPDHRIAAEAHYAKDLPEAPRILISHDIQPLLAATGIGMKAHRISDTWLRPPEPSAKDKRIVRLEQQISSYKKSEPQFEVEMEVRGDRSLSLVKLSDLTAPDREDLTNRILQLNPKKRQREGYMRGMHPLEDYDGTYDRRYKKWRDERLPAFMADYERQIVITHNQAWFSMTLKNTGEVQAESLRVDLTLNHGWFNERPFFVSPRGPKAPVQRSSLYHLHNLPGIDHGLLKRARHDFGFDPAPSRASEFAALCDDFRHGHNWTFDGVIGFDVYASAPTIINVAVTAANYHGTVCVDKEVAWTCDEITLDDFVDRDQMRMNRETIIDPLIDEERYDEIDFDSHTDD